MMGESRADTGVDGSESGERVEWVEGGCINGMG